MDDNAKRWFLKHSHREICPPCAGRKRAINLEPQIVRCPCICPKCKKLWIYKTQIESRVKDRRPMWYYCKEQLNEPEECTTTTKET